MKSLNCLSTVNSKFNYDVAVRTETNDLFTEYLNDPSYLDCYETEIDNIDGITIYPNPFIFQTTIVFENEQYQSKIQLFDARGIQISETKFTGQQMTLQAPAFAQGIYFIRITDVDNRVVTKKVIIQ